MPQHWIFAFEGQVSNSELQVADYVAEQLVAQFQREADVIARELEVELSKRLRGRFRVIIDFSEGSFEWFGEVHFYLEWMATVGGAIGLAQLIASVISRFIRRRLNRLRTRPRTRVTVISRPRLAVAESELSLGRLVLLSLLAVNTAAIAVLIAVVIVLLHRL